MLALGSNPGPGWKKHPKVLLTRTKPTHHDEDAWAGRTCEPDNSLFWWRLSANLTAPSQGLETFRRDRGSCRQVPSCCPIWRPTGRWSSTSCFQRRKCRGRNRAQRRLRVLGPAGSRADGAFDARGWTRRCPPGFSVTWNIEFWPKKLFPKEMQLFSKKSGPCTI